MKYKERTIKQLKHKFLYRKVLAILFLSILLIISLVNYNRVMLFSSIFGGMKYFIATIYFLAFVIDIILIGYFLFSSRHLDYSDPESISKIEKSYKPIDIPTFLCHCIAFIMFILVFILTPCTVSGKSMNNTLENQDRLICSSLFYTPKNGDIIVFDSAKYTNNDHELYIKRIIAVEGDTLHYNSSEMVLYVNDVIACTGISASQYVTIIGRNEIVDFELPKDKLVVFGDNRSNSLDSRVFGLIDEADIFGRVLFRIFPFKGIEESIIE